MSFGPEFVRGLQAALNQRLPWRVARVEGGESWIALRVDGRDESSPWFLLSWGPGSAGCCLADAPSVDFLKKSAPARAPLVEALRSRLLKGRLLSARQAGTDRVLELAVSRLVAAGFEVRYFLILEATEPTGNLVLLDGERRIEELARHAPPDVNLYRTLLPGHPYVPPPPFDGPLPSEADESGFESPHGLRGIGRPLARLIEAHWAERPPRAWLADLRALYAEGPEGHEGESPSFACQVTAKGHLTRFPFVFPEAEQVGGDELAAAREGVLRPLLTGARARLLRNLNARTDRAAKAMERRLDGLAKRLGDNAEAEMFRRKGQLLLANLAAVPPRAEKVTLTDWGGAALDIALDPRLPPSRNAERYFRKYKKARCDPERTREEIASLEGAIGELREQGSLLAAIEDPVKFEEAVRDVEDWLAGDRRDKREGDKGKKGGRGKGRSAALPPHLRFEIGGVVVLVGLSARGNRYVTFKQAAADDLWLHAHEVPGAHVVVHGTSVHGTSARGANARGASGREGFDPEVLRFAASLAAAHSRAKDALSVQVDYTERRHVRAVPGTVALVTYTNPGTIRAAPRLWKEFEKEPQRGRIPDAQGV